MNDRQNQCLLMEDGSPLFHFRGTLSLVYARHLDYLTGLENEDLREVGMAFAECVCGLVLGPLWLEHVHTVLCTLVVFHQSSRLSDAALRALEGLVSQVPQSLALGLNEDNALPDKALQVEPCFWAVNGTSRVPLPWRTAEIAYVEGISVENSRLQLHMV